MSPTAGTCHMSPGTDHSLNGFQRSSTDPALLPRRPLLAAMKTTLITSAIALSLVLVSCQAHVVINGGRVGGGSYGCNCATLNFMAARRCCATVGTCCRLGGGLGLAGGLPYGGLGGYGGGLGGYGGGLGGYGPGLGGYGGGLGGYRGGLNVNLGGGLF
ncbi:acanthoscurrin-2-like [Ixodes scapularis]